MIYYNLGLCAIYIKMTSKNKRKRSYDESFLKLGFTELNGKLYMFKNTGRRINEEKQTTAPFDYKSPRLYR